LVQLCRARRAEIRDLTALRLRVLHLVPALFGSDGGLVGGAERFALELARHMADVIPTRLLSFGDEERRETFGHLSVRVAGRPWYVRGQRSNPLSAAILSEIRRADVVHCHQQHVVASTIAALFCRATGRRVFVSPLGGGGWDVSGYVKTDRWYHGRLHISEYSRRVYGSERGSRVIYGGVDIERFAPPANGVKRDTVLFVGRILPHKGVDVLIDAVTADMRVEIIGPASDGGFVRDLRVLASGKTVTFRHDADDKELIAAYRRALCVVLPSVYRTRYGTETLVPELLGQTLLEGMACGAPTVATDVASLPEIVADGVTGFVVPPGNPQALGERLRWLNEHREAADEMGRAGRQRVIDRFTWPAVVQRCLTAYGA
jgi:glycosyltransferase involved in cell wall biosynthesis